MPAAEKKDPNKMLFQIRILSSDGDKVNVNLPLTLVRFAIETGNTALISMGGQGAALRDIDWNQLFALIDQGVMGKIVEIESAEGDFVEIFVS